ncbi:DUF4126 domain-containing protein [Sanguibacter sp. A247]|uniref:DUF4126 domain-containing protein n=1 Tax=unclassified Sanguibacter TaxID=2645534 RepID=UPI003FD709D2
MIELLTGTSLATAAGLNAYVPLVVLGLADRFTTVLELPGAWSWLSSWPALAILTVLLVVEMVADKVPAIDSVNDVLQTVVRPTAGGLVVGAGTAAEHVVDGGAWSGTNGWAVALGVLIALVVHLLKSSVRPVLNAATLGVAAPVVSTVEDASSVALSVLAILVPVLAALGVLAIVVVLVRLRRRRRTAPASAPTL